MLVGSNLALQWVPGSGKVVRGDTKMSSGSVSLGVLQRGVSEIFKHLTYRYSPIVKYENLDFKNLKFRSISPFYRVSQKGSHF